MAWGTKPRTAPRRTLTAAATAIPLDGTSWKNWKFGDQKWQQEAWRHYDICGELRFVANWVGNAVSRCRLYVAEIDDAGRPGDEASDPDLQAIAETMFGGPSGRAEAQRALGIHLTVPGEAYICAESLKNKNEDIWYTLSTSEVRRTTDRIYVERSNVYGGGRHELQEGRDLLIRVWTPHPRRHDLADSAVRAILPILREIEQLTKHVFAQIDSRLAGAGLLLLPEGIDFPRGPEDPEGLAGFMHVLTRAMGAALQNREDAASMVPVMAEIPIDALDKIKHLTFETPLGLQARDLRQEAIRRLALAMDVPPEVLLGQGSANHWSAWQIEESAVKIHVVPVISRIADALTTAYLRPALEVAGEDPEKYTFWFDTTPLTQRPDRHAEAKDLHATLVVSDKVLRDASNYGDDDAPDESERNRRLAVELLRADPQLLGNAGLVKLAGLPENVVAAPPPGMEPPPPAGAPAEDQGFPAVDAPPPARGLPSQPTDTATPAQQGLTAALEVGADLVVRRAMELAGKRLLTRAARVEGKGHGIPAERLHTQLKVLDHAHACALLAGAFEHVPDLAGRVGTDPQQLADLLGVYCTELLLRAAPHEPLALRMWLDAGLKNGASRAG